MQMKNVTHGYDAEQSGGLTGDLTKAVNMFGTCGREFSFYLFIQSSLKSLSQRTSKELATFSN